MTPLLVAPRPRTAPPEEPAAAVAGKRYAPAELADLLASGFILDVAFDATGRAIDRSALVADARSLARGGPPGAAAAVLRAWATARRAHVPVALAHRGMGGDGARWLETTIAPLGGGMRIVTRDVSALAALGRQVRELRAERDALRRLVHVEDDDRALTRAAADVARLMGGARAVISRGHPDALGAERAWSAGGPGGSEPAAGLATPVRIGGRIWGTLAIGAAAGAPLTGGEERLEAVADVLGVAIAGAQARARMASLDDRDPLTGLANHRAFYRELERVEQRGGRLALALLDVDAFREVNRAHGHERADRVLIELADHLRAAAGLGQMVARIGGEEFAWLLPDTDAPSALESVEAARAGACAQPLAGIGPLRVSVGVSDLALAGTGAELIRQADAALRDAKESGRNGSRSYRPRMGLVAEGRQVAEAAARATSLRALRALARAADAKDPSTQRHSSRVADLAAILAVDLGWPAGRVAQLREAALLHDVGKIGVPDQILFKRGSLTEAEYGQVKQHAAIGAEIASEALSAEQTSWVRYHHERWDGAGYPDGVAGSAIPQGARILAAADTWDAMTRFRHYRRPVPPRRAITECRREAGSQLDPQVVAALVGAWERGELIVGHLFSARFLRLPAAAALEQPLPPSSAA